MIEPVERHYEERLLDEAITELGVEPEVAHYLRRRYLEYLRWLEDASARNLVLYYGLRIPALVLAATVPALVALDLRVTSIVLGILVAAATGVEHLLSSGRRWRHYRGTAELMKSEAWLFLARGGTYSAYRTHAEALPTFVTRAEALVRDEVREYVSTVVAERQAGAVAPAQPPA